MQKRRDNAYFIERLKAERPDVWEKYQAGGYKSARAAFLDAGLTKPRQVLPKLKTLWRQANFEERAEFMVYLQEKGELTQPYRLTAAVMADISERASLPDDDDRSGWMELPFEKRKPLPLRPKDRLAIIRIMKTRGWIDANGTYHAGEVLEELERSVRPRIPELARMKFRKQEPSLSHALKVNWKLRPALLVALDVWLKDVSVA